MIRGKKDYLLICPRCIARSDLTTGVPDSIEPIEPLVKRSWSTGTTRGVMALVLALGRLVRKKTRTREEIGS